MGVVYEAVHTETERSVALKLIRPELLDSAEVLERFRREARVAARIDSDFVVEVLDAGVDAKLGVPFLAMELLRGQDLGAKLDGTAGLPAAEAIKYLWQVALALDAAHESSVVHRDLKPENIFLSKRRGGGVRVKVLDFGIAKLLLDSAHTTQVTGTLLYMAPEQLRQPVRVSPATDLYALGMVTFALFAGRPYWTTEYDRGGVAAVAGVVVSGRLPEVASERAKRLGAFVPHGFDAWFARATHADRSRRFTRATVQVGELCRALGLPPPFERDSRRPPPMAVDALASTVSVDRPTAVPPERRWLGPVAAVTVVAAMVLVVVAVQTYLARSQVNPRLRAIGRITLPRAELAPVVASSETAVPVSDLPLEPDKKHPQRVLQPRTAPIETLPDAAAEPPPAIPGKLPLEKNPYPEPTTTPQFDPERL